MYANSDNWGNYICLFNLYITDIYYSSHFVFYPQITDIDYSSHSVF